MKMIKKKTKVNYSLYKKDLLKLIDFAKVELSELLPSEWAELNRYLTQDTSSVPGLFSFDNSPYTREILDCLSESHPSKIIAVMKAAQIGFSTSVIENGIGWIIANNPGNILFLVGHEDLVKDAVKKIDTMLDNSGLRKMIKSSSQRVRNVKSGDTDTLKEFPNGQLKLGIANHKMLRNISVMYGFIDDYESMRSDSKQSGSTAELIEQRFAAFKKKMKLFYISTPELKETSNIEPVYLNGDQRKYHIPCPCCGTYISIEWETTSKINKNEKAGITWEVNHEGELLAESVGYTCQECGGFFNDDNKTELIQLGKWFPTAKSIKPGYYSYHISALYAPVFMYGWEDYVRKYLECYNSDGNRDENKYKTFVNLVLGLPYEQTGESIKANDLMKNIRNYEIGTIPEKQSIRDGNGKIVMITCGSDLNGKEDDARLDYEIVAHSENGSTYSICHGSIGTFIPREKEKTNRKKYTYRFGEENSVWDVFKELLEGKFRNDNTGKNFKIFMTGLDTGYMENYAMQFLNTNRNNLSIIGLKGDDDLKFVSLYVDSKTYRRSKENPNLYMVATNYTKDVLARDMKLEFDSNIHKTQPKGFMNFPKPKNGFYEYENFFSHFEAEHKIIDDKNKFRWVKKTNKHQNHLFDCRLYAMVTRDIFVDSLLRSLKIQNGDWQDYINIVLKK